MQIARSLFLSVGIALAAILMLVASEASAHTQGSAGSETTWDSSADTDVDCDLHASSAGESGGAKTHAHCHHLGPQSPASVGIDWRNLDLPAATERPVMAIAYRADTQLADTPIAVPIIGPPLIILFGNFRI